MTLSPKAFVVVWLRYCNCNCREAELRLMLDGNVNIWRCLQWKIRYPRSLKKSSIFLANYIPILECQS